MMPQSSVAAPKSQIFGVDLSWLTLGLLIMFLLAALIRRDDIWAPGFAPTKEYTSAIIARGFYFIDNADILPWRQEIAVKNKDQQPILEPPFTEYMVALIYQVMGKEQVWYAHYLTSFFWLIGGIFLYKTTKVLLSVHAAVVATAYYLFAPMGILVSKSFQPEALMMMMYMISLYCIIMYFESPTSSRLLLSAVLTGATLLIRPLVIFPLFGAFLALSIHKKRSFLRVIDRSFIIFFVISLIAPLTYYGYGILIADFMRWKVAHSFRPHLLTYWQYWNDWFGTALEVVGSSATVAAVLGFFFLPKGTARSLSIGLLVSYIIFGLVFNFHIMTHSYYHVQVLPIIGICMAPLVVNILTSLKQIMGRYTWAPVTLALLLGLYFSYRQVQANTNKTHFETPNLAREIGQIINHSPQVVTVAHEYGLPLSYYGEFAGTWWPAKADYGIYRRPADKELSVQERLDLLSFQPEYFVITNFDLYNSYSQDLRAYLENTCSPLAETNAYLIYANCRDSAAR